MTKSVKNVKINRGNKAVLGDYGVTDDRSDRGQQQGRGFSDRQRFPTPGPSQIDRSFGGDEPSRRYEKQGFK